MAVVAVVVIIYSIKGGLWSISLTDFFQMLMIVFGMIAVLPYSLEMVGGWGMVVETLPAKSLSRQLLSHFYPDNAVAIEGWEEEHVAEVQAAVKNEKTALLQPEHI